MVSALGYRVSWTPAGTKRTNDTLLSIPCNYSLLFDGIIFSIAELPGVTHWPLCVGTGASKGKREWRERKQHVEENERAENDGKIFKIISESLYRDTDRRVVFKFCEI